MLIRLVLGGSLLMAAFLASTACSESAGTAGPAPSPDTRPAQTTQSGQRHGRALVFYAEIDKAGDYFRRMFIDSASAQVVRRTGTLPEGALLVMETWFGRNQSTVFIRQQRQGAWLSGSFGPGSPNYTVNLNQSCNNCHQRAAVTELTFTKPLLLKALQRGEPQTIVCNEPSFTPCDLSVYQGN